jgi:hypothetical protein
MRAWIVWPVGLLSSIVAVLDRTTRGVSGLVVSGIVELLDDGRL